MQNQRKGEEGVRANNVKILSQQLEELRTGKDLANLDFGAKNWFGQTLEARTEDEPVKRIQQQTNDKITEAIVEGFDALLKMATPPYATRNCRFGSKGKTIL